MGKKTKQYQKLSKKNNLQVYKISLKEKKLFESFKIMRCHPLYLQKHNKQNLDYAKARNNDENKKKLQNEKRKNSKK